MKKQLLFVKQAIFFANNREDVHFKDGRVVVSLPDISLQWDAEIISDEDGKMVFLCR